MKGRILTWATFAGLAVAGPAWMAAGSPAGAQVGPPKVDVSASIGAGLVTQDTTGKAIFEGKGNCHTCHGPDAKGTVLAPDLTDSKWIHIDGSEAAIEKLVTTGVPEPKEHPAPMPPMGGAQLTKEEVHAVAGYVYSLSHPKK